MIPCFTIVIGLVTMAAAPTTRRQGTVSPKIPSTRTVMKNYINLSADQLATMKQLAEKLPSAMQDANTPLQEQAALLNHLLDMMKQLTPEQREVMNSAISATAATQKVSQ
jgi:hypothetical protein